MALIHCDFFSEVLGLPCSGGYDVPARFQRRLEFWLKVH